MGNADWYAGMVCHTQHVPAEVVDMAMDDIIRPVRSKNVPQAAGIPPWTVRVEAGKNARPILTNLRVVCARLAGMDEKVHLKSAPIDVSQDVDKPGFHAAKIQRPQHVKYPNRFFLAHHNQS